MFKMPRVVPDQKTKFESDELFRRLARETEQVRYTGFRDRPSEERRQKFQSQCRDGCTELAFVNTGLNLYLSFTPAPGGYSPDVDFNKEPGKLLFLSLLGESGARRWGPSGGAGGGLREVKRGVKVGAGRGRGRGGTAFKSILKAGVCLNVRPWL
ncbi:hypothetical protein O3P69_013025 [Scylla paramamosain]|uniref:Uncharacterized protein n=1 Tax=Scylla paramamosain TaxID=85552 RepID=A0AAW0TSM7_SCYPA